jgi:hypothetical protein
VAYNLQNQVVLLPNAKSCARQQRWTTTAVIAMKIQSACVLLVLCLVLLPSAAVAQSDTTGQKLSHAPGEGAANCLVPNLHNCKFELWAVHSVESRQLLPCNLAASQTNNISSHFIPLLVQGTRLDPMLLVS